MNFFLRRSKWISLITLIALLCTNTNLQAVAMPLSRARLASEVKTTKGIKAVEQGKSATSSLNQFPAEPKKKAVKTQPANKTTKPGFTKIENEAIKQIQAVPTASSPIAPSTLRPASFCVHQVNGLDQLLRSNKLKRQANLRLRDAIAPIVKDYKDLTVDELGDLEDSNPGMLEKLLLDADFDDKINSVAKHQVSFRNAFNRTWSAMTEPRCFPVVAKDFLTLSAVGFQHGIEEVAGPLLHSTARYVPDEYENYIVAEQIPYKILRGLIDNKYDTIAKRALEQLAFYLAGAGAADIQLFEHGIVNSAEFILTKYREQGMQEFEARFVHLIAPIFVMTCDSAGINRGLGAPSCSFLNRHSQQLQDGVREMNGGWAGGELTLWSREYGQLISFPVGITGATSCNEFDPNIFARSFTNGALNFGDCGMASVVRHCPQTMGNTRVYAHLCHLCNSQGAGEGDIRGRPAPSGSRNNNNSGFEGGSTVSVGGRSGGLSSRAQDFLNRNGPTSIGGVDVQSVKQQLCGQAGNGIQSHDYPKPDQCGVQHQEQTVCGADANEVAGSETAFAGAPTGQQCNDLAAGGGDLSPAALKAAWDRLIPSVEQSLEKLAEKIATPAERAALERLKTINPKLYEQTVKQLVEGSLKSAGQQLGNAGRGVASFITAVGSRLIGVAFIIVSPEVIQRLQQNPNAQPVPIAQTGTNNNNGSNNSTNNNGDTQVASNTTSSSSGTTPGASPANPTIRPAPADGFEPGDDDCTYVGQLMKAVNSCHFEQLNRGLTAAGRPMRQAPARGSIGPDRGPKSHPTGDEVEETDAVGACHIGELATPARSGIISGGGCGLANAMICGDLSSSAASCCGQTEYVNLAENCPVCDGVPAVLPNGRCASECPMESQPQGTPSTGPRPIPFGTGINPLVEDGSNPFAAGENKLTRLETVEGASNPASNHAVTGTNTRTRDQAKTTQGYQRVANGLEGQNVQSAPSNSSTSGQRSTNSSRNEVEQGLYRLY